MKFHNYSLVNVEYFSDVLEIEFSLILIMKNTT